MRGIEFRGKQDGNGKWMFGDLAHGDDGSVLITQTGSCVMYDVDPETVGQYTGLKDKNGVKIFEGDIVRSAVDNPTLKDNYRVDWHLASSGYVVYNKSGRAYSITDSDFYYLEVIGNIHDNPELLHAGGGA
jgi:uncharacterized phage protein (TIGR01671 family)